jgi:hypothetical protein
MIFKISIYLRPLLGNIALTDKQPEIALKIKYNLIFHTVELPFIEFDGYFLGDLSL